MSTIKLNGSSSGNAQVTVAAAAGTPTITLPTASIDLSSAGSDGQFLKTNGSGTLSFADAPAGGKILQVVGNLNTGGGTSTTSTSWTETYITDTITPTALGSKIAVFATGMGGYIAGSGTGNMTIGRNVNSEGWSYMGDSTNGMAYIYAHTEDHYTAAFSYLDSPTYTSGEAIEYSIFMKVGGTVSAFSIGNSNSHSPIILMEVAA